MSISLIIIKYLEKILMIQIIFTIFFLPVSDLRRNYRLHKIFSQNIKTGNRRSLCDISEKGILKRIFNDPDLQKQWYFVRSDPFSNHLSHNLDTCWKNKIYGQGVTVGIIGDAINFMHPDLENNFNRILSYNFVNSYYNIYRSENSSTTISAGLISAVADNYICGTGAAPMSKFASLKVTGIDDEELENINLSSALIINNDIIQIYLITSVAKFSLKARNIYANSVLTSLDIGIKFGRKYLGSVYIAGSGDERKTDNNCAFNFLLQQPEVLVFGSINNVNNYTEYSEHCTAILAASISSENIDQTNELFYKNLNNLCQNSAKGSIASAAISAGIIALLISSNPDLTVRQIMVLIILTSIQHDSNAIINNATFYYSYSYGFGLLNAEELIQWSISEEIRILPPEHQCFSKFIFITQEQIRNEILKIYIYTSGCLNNSFCVTEIEQVYLIITAKTWKRNCISMYLISPCGTKFEIIKPRIFDKSRNGILNWKLKILGYFGESPQGVWTLEVIAKTCVCRVSRIKLIFYGTCQNSQINVLAHGLVKSYLCSGQNVINSDIYNTICKPKNFDLIRSNISIDSYCGIDIWSFFDHSNPNLLILNNLT